MDFNAIYAAWSPRIFRVCMGYVNDIEKARDLTQETFITVWQHLPTFRQEANIGTWIFRIATNNCLRAIEQSKRIPQATLPEELPQPEDPSIEPRLQLLYKCISELEETERILIALTLEDIPQAEIAQIMGLTPGNTRVKIHRIREKLFNKMKQYGRTEGY